MFVLLSLACTTLCARLPTYKYFVIPDGYVETDIKEEIVQNCYNFSVDLVKKFLDDFTGPQPIVLLHAWNKKGDDGEYFACEVMRMKLKYLLIVHIPNIENAERKFLHSVRILNEETPSGAHWFHPPSDVLEIVMKGINEKYGNDVQLRNVAVYKTVMNYHKYGQIVIDTTKGEERMLFNIKLIQKFGEKSFQISSIEQIY
ncbi:hypothetical protein TRFO_17732 [Tritrichomonas foetus]|uniref:Uncharacterized protein n=1 Tax=Tritrichomonas foetus TaxID=1144522 RepID=A0A1J4KRL1_9EUKA|nr:hypothetical protein TRFO_17732 [Tritrichomonas foetus]|eukprot:OHT12452.1 hypothetical protein TRFO_17732 [Tritrichomonas foetus]